MVRALHRAPAETAYLEFFGLTQSPFDNMSDPDQLYTCEQYSLLQGHLNHAADNADSILVVCGQDGCGKSTLQKKFLATLNDRVSCVTIDQDCRNEEQFYHSFLTQIGFDDISGNGPELRNITREFLVCRGISGDHVLLIIDNAHLASPIVIEQLRQLCALKVKDRRLLSVVLFGNFNIVHVLEAPTMRKISFRDHRVFYIRSYSEQETKDYSWHRLKLAGGEGNILIPGESISLIHQYSGGIPQQINHLFDEVLKRAYALKSNVVTDEIVQTVSDRLRLHPVAPSSNGNSRRKTDPARKAPDIKAVPSLTNLRHESGGKKLEQLQGQVEALINEKSQVQQQLESRDRDIVGLRDALESRTTEIEGLKHSIADLRKSLRSHLAATDEKQRSDEEAAADRVALLENELAGRDESIVELRSELAKAKEAESLLAQEKRARTNAEDELAQSKRELENLRADKKDLHATIHKLNSELREAGERALSAYALERKVEELQAEVASMTVALETRDDALSEAEVELEAIREKSDETRRDTGTACQEVSTSASEIDLPVAARKIEQVFGNRQAYRTLRICNPTAYERLVDTYRSLSQQGLTEEEIETRLRAEQARLIERLLPRASDGAIIAYIQLMLHQLSEFIFGGTEPCLTLLVPKPDPSRHGAARYSEISADRELDVLDMILKTHSEECEIPAEEDVWPNLEPIFAATMEEFGAENVAAIENSFDPDVDRKLVSRISKSIYTQILGLPKADAANAARWLLTAR